MVESKIKIPWMMLGSLIVRDVKVEPELTAAVD